MNRAVHMLGKQNKDSLVKMLLHSSTNGQKLKEEVYVDTEDGDITSSKCGMLSQKKKQKKTAAAMIIKTVVCSCQKDTSVKEDEGA